MDHGRRPADVVLVHRFLGRLEEEAHPALPRLGGVTLAQQVGHAEQDGRVGVVAAGVHDARFARAVRRVVGLDDGQRVHVGADGDGRAGVAQFGDDACLADAGTNGVAANFVQRVVDQRRRLVLAEAQFGIGMDRPAQADDLIL